MTSGVMAADGAGLAAALGVLGAGGVVGVPTDTVYGLAVDPTRPGATGRLFHAKGRPRQVPVAVLVADAAQGWALASPPLPPAATALALEHWPGALTIVVDRLADWPADLGDESGTVGLRCPDHPWMRELCRRAGPLATTSANLHGQPPLTEASGVREAFGALVDLVIDGGVCDGTPSTVVDCTTPVVRVVREGRIALA